MASKKNTTKLNISGNKAIEVEVGTIEVSKLILDPTNPRFVHRNRLLSDQEMHKEIWEEGETKELYTSIVASKGISEHIYIRPNGVVIEGNRRTVCLRELKKNVESGLLKNVPKTAYQEIPVYIFEKDVPDIDIDILLARLHVTGKKPWSALNQAEHIFKLYSTHGRTYDQISELINMSKGKVYQKYWSYGMTKEFLKQYPQADVKNYSFFEEAYKKKKIRDLLDLSSFKKKFYKWILTNRFDVTGAKDVRELIDIMDKPDIYKEFQEKGMEAARIKLAKIEPAYESDTFRDIENAIFAIKDMPRSEFQEIPSNKAKIKLLKNLKSEINKVFEQLNIK